MRVTGKAQSAQIQTAFLEYIEECMKEDYPEELGTVGAHFLKTVQPHYSAIAKGEGYSGAMEDGQKLAEIRKDDRNFREGDFLCLEEYPYTGNAAIAYITHKLSSEDFPEGLVKGYCMLSVDVVLIIAGLNDENLYTVRSAGD